MDNRLGLTTLSDFISILVRSAWWVVDKDDRDPEYESTDSATISRSVPALEVLSSELEKARKGNGKPDASTVGKAIAEAQERIFDEFGVRLRHPEVWFCYPLETVYSQIETMQRRNIEREIALGPQQLRSFLLRWSMRDDISEVDVATKPKVIKLFEEEFNVDEDDETPFASFMMEFAEDYGISLNEREMEELEKTKLMESVFETLSRKLAQRPANDGTVHYGKMWSWELTRETRQYFDRMGGLRGAGRGAPLKHCSSVFDILGSSHGLTDRVPEDERVGRLAEAADPIRVYLRTQSSGSPTDYRGLVAYLNADLAKNKDSEHAVYFDYRDVDDLIDDGWAID